MQALFLFGSNKAIRKKIQRPSKKGCAQMAIVKVHRFEMYDITKLTMTCMSICKHP